ncbi:midkine b [Aplochiton taeniatus]
MRMQGVLSITLVLLVALAVTTEANKGHKGHKGKHDKNGKEKPGSDCTEWHYGKCVPESDDCGEGLREATCKEDTQKIKCRIPCNWKKDISDCKYKFTNWEECDPATNTKSRSGTLKKAMFNADCQSTVKVSKPCSAKPKTRAEKRKKAN